MGRTVFDFIIVGAGSAGCVLAERLSRDPAHSVLVLEAGGSDDSPLVLMPMLMGLAIQSKAFNWHYETEAQTALNGRRLYWPRGRTLGGSSAINAMHYIRGAPENYDEWRDLYGCEGWGWDTALPAFREVEGHQGGGDHWHGADGPLTVQEVRPLNRLTEGFFEAGALLQYPRNADFNGAAQLGFGPYQVTQRGLRRWSAADAFLKPALGRPNLTVRTGALVHRVVLEGGVATGVEVEIAGQTLSLSARREVILCGGAVNSPQLLQLSGIGDVDDLRAAGVTPVIDLPGVGRNLQDHIDIIGQISTRSATSIGLSLRALPTLISGVAAWMGGRPGPLSTNPIQGGAFVRSSRAGDLPDIQLVFTPGLAAPHGRELPVGHGATLHACVLYPESRGRIRIVSPDPAVPPAIDPAYLTVGTDLEVLTDGLQMVRTLLGSAAFAFDRRAELLPGPDRTSRADLMDDVRARAETLYHPVGTCAMGTGELAVVDPQLRVRGVKRLRVVDASVMPRLIGGNTNAPTIMIATRAAPMILETT
ncbi:GMC family oxidoreductase [Brevundimonas sp. R86498]|uniref:GMC family oxidoreductase n=1 Tax=Brevundimonas sp. R86498 TaxID=3093845 RepID=UPI0037C986E2